MIHALEPSWTDQDTTYFSVIKAQPLNYNNSDKCFQGLFTLSTVIVDYRGYRVIAQSIIPGKYWYLCSLASEGFLLFASPILFYHLCQMTLHYIPHYAHKLRTCQRIQVYLSAWPCCNLFVYFVITLEVTHCHFVCYFSTAGILQREQEQSVVYGSIDSGKNISSHAKFLELVSYRGCFHEYVFQGHHNDCVSQWLTVPFSLSAIQGWQIY